MRNKYTGADFDLDEVRKDFRRVVEVVPWEVPALRQSVVQGKIDGNTYSGPCCCLVGTIANNLGIGGRISDLKVYGIRANASFPIEVFFVHIREGDTPETNPYSKQVLEWCEEFIAQEEAKQVAQIGASVQAGLEEVLAAAALPVVEEEVPELVHA